MNIKNRWIAFGFLALLLLYAGSGFYTVAQDEVAVVLQFGAYCRTTSSGLNYHIPWPVESLFLVKTSAVYPMSVGYKILDEIRGVAPNEEEMQWLVGDTNLIDIRLEIQYRISEPQLFLFKNEEPRFLIRRASEAALTEIVSAKKMDELLTYGKTALSNQVLQRVQELLDDYQCGLLLNSVNVVALDPPQQVQDAFVAVKQAEANSQRILLEAQGNEKKLMAQTWGEVQTIQSKAKIKYEARVAEAQADTHRFLNILEQYRKNPEGVKSRMYYQTMQKLLPKLKIKTYPAESEETTKFQLLLSE